MFNNINEVDLNIQLFLDKYIDILNVGKLYCLTNNEIKKLRFNNYQLYLSILCVERDNIQNLLSEEYKNEEMSTFIYIIVGCIQDSEFKKLILKALSAFIKEEVFFSKPLECFYIGDISENRFIDINNYEYIKYILKKQNGLKVEEPEKYANSIAKQMADKIKEMRNKYSKCSNNNEDIYDYSDILSSVCAKHNNINPFNIGELTIYQTIDQFKRLNMIDKFEIDIQSLLHGAKKENIGLKSWFNKINI